MKRLSQKLILPGLVLALFIGTAQGYTVFLDMDVSTSPAPPPGPGGPPSPPLGIESTIGVTSGTTVTVIAYIQHATGAASFDAVGMDIQYKLPADTATATYVPGTNLAGGITTVAFPPAGFDLVAAAPAPPGALLTSAGLAPPIAPYSFNVGGSGIFDAMPGSYFGGFGTGLSGTYFDVMGFDFLVTGSPGDVVTLDPVGIFLPGSYGAGTPPPGVPFLPGPGAEAVYDSVTGLTTPGLFVGGTITIIPEPSSVMLVSLGLIGFSLRRRR